MNSMEATGGIEDSGPGGGPRKWLLVVAVLVVLAVVGVVVLMLQDDGDSIVSSETATSSTAQETTITSNTTSSTTEPQTTTTTTAARSVSDAEAVNVVFPAPNAQPGYNGPRDVARGFAEDLVALEDPTIGEFRQGDLRSGEVDVGAPDDPVTTVLVRQLSDDRWYVVGAVAGDIQVDDPIAGGAIDHPLIISGRARTDDGELRVTVHLRQDGTELGAGAVSAGTGPGLASFDGEVSWRNPGGGWGVVLVSSGRDGTFGQLVAVPVGFIGGD